MIKSLAIVSLLSCGVGSQATPHFNNEQINETKHVEQRRLYENNTSGSQQDAELTWEINTNLGERTQNVEREYSYSNQSTRALAINRKWENYVQAQQASMHIYTYANKTILRLHEYRDIDNYKTGWFFPIDAIPSQTYNQNENSHRNTELYQIEFAPYNSLQTSYIDLAFNIDVKGQIETQGSIPIIPPIPPSSYAIGIRHKISYYITTQNNWSQYFDYTMTENEKSNWETIENITNSQNGYTYQKIEKTIDVDIGMFIKTIGSNETKWTSNENQRITITQQIPIANDNINYICIYMERSAYIKPTEWSLSELPTYSQLQEWQVGWKNDSGFEYQNYARIQDAYNNVESTILNLNTENVKQYWALDHVNTIKTYGTWLPNITQEVIDIPGIMFHVLGMPWTFISTAFNLTLFPGTPYSVNVGSIIAMVLGVLIFVFLIKLIIFKVK